jgi:hypothetical protein
MGQLVVVSRAFQPANKFFGTDWRARFWVRCSNLTAKAHVILFFEDTDGKSHPSIENNVASGTISSAGVNVVGSGTAFTTELQVGDLILASDQVRRIVSIADDFDLQVDVAFSPVLAADEFIFQKFTILDPSLAPLAADGAVVVQTTARDFGRFEALDVKLLFNDVVEDDVIDITIPYLTNEIGKSLHLGDSTIPRNKQREYKLYRMAVANPDVFTELETGLVGANARIEAESIALVAADFTSLTKRNLFPFSEVVFREGIKAQGTIQYAGQPADGDTITIGVNIFEFDNNVVFAVGHNPVTIGATAEDTFQNLVDSINVLSPLASATHVAAKHTVTVQALLAGADGNGIVFAQDCSVAKLTPIIGTLDGGVDGEQYARGTDYVIRYEEGQIARTSQGRILDPSPSDLVVTYSYFPGDVPLNTSYSQTIKPVGVKLEIDPTCLFFFRGRMHDFTDVNAVNVNFDAIERTPSRFSYLRPKVPGRHAQVVHFSASTPHLANLDYAAMVDQDATLVKTDAAGNTTAIPLDNPKGWFFTSDQQIQLSTSVKYLAPGETALFDPDAVYEFVYHVKFQFTTAPIGIADVSSAYALLPYSYKARQVEETKEDVEQTLFLDTTRRAKLKLPAIMDQALAELTRFLGGQTEVLSDDQWQFVDQSTVEVFLSAFDPAAIYTLTYKSSKISYGDPTAINELFEIARSDDGLTFSAFEPFAPGDVFTLANYVKFRATVFGDFDTDAYRLRGFSGIADDATIVEGGFGLSPFGRFPFGDGGVCLEDDSTDLLGGSLLLGGTLGVVVS